MIWHRLFSTKCIIGQRDAVSGYYRSRPFAFYDGLPPQQALEASR